MEIKLNLDAIQMQFRETDHKLDLTIDRAKNR